MCFVVIRTQVELNTTLNLGNFHVKVDSSRTFSPLSTRPAEIKSADAKHLIIGGGGDKIIDCHGI